MLLPVVQHVDSSLITPPVIGRGIDFPNVSLVAQAGLPATSDAYVHRVGRTARAGKDGRAVILLTQGESFFLSINRQFKITPHPASEKIVKDTQSVLDANRVLETIDDHDKQKAYSAYLGFMKGFMNKMKLDAQGLVRMANEFALEGMGCEEVPEMEKKTIGYVARVLNTRCSGHIGFTLADNRSHIRKMGLKGAPGIRYATTDLSGGRAAPQHPIRVEKNYVVPSRRITHQGPPEYLDGQRYGDSEGTPSHGAGSGRGGRGGRGGGGGGRQRKRGTLR